MPQAAQTRRRPRPDPCRARWRHSSPRPPPPQRAKVSVLASSVPPGSTLRFHGAIQFRLHRIALALRARRRSRRSLSHATSKILRPTGATEVAPARHAKAAERPHACAPPSIAGQVPAGLPAKPGLGKTWTSQARPHLPQAQQQQLSSQNYRSCSGPPSLRLSQFWGPTQRAGTARSSKHACRASASVIPVWRRGIIYRACPRPRRSDARFRLSRRG